MPGVVVRYAKGKGFLMDEHLAKVWVCSQLTNIIRNLSEEQAGISLHSQWICAECRTALPMSSLQRKRQLLPQRSTIRITLDNLTRQYAGLLIAKHCGETAQLFGDLLLCAAARRQCIVDATFHRKPEHGHAHGAVWHRVEDYRFCRFGVFDGDGAQQWQRRVIDDGAISQGRV